MKIWGSARIIDSLSGLYDGLVKAVPTVSAHSAVKDSTQNGTPSSGEPMHPRSAIVVVCLTALLVGVADSARAQCSIICPANMWLSADATCAATPRVPLRDDLGSCSLAHYHLIR